MGSVVSLLVREVEDSIGEEDIVEAEVEVEGVIEDVSLCMAEEEEVIGVEGVIEVEEEEEREIGVEEEVEI